MLSRTQCIVDINNKMRLDLVANPNNLPFNVKLFSIVFPWCFPFNGQLLEYCKEHVQYAGLSDTRIKLLFFTEVITEVIIADRR